MPVIEITSLSDARVQLFSALTEAQLRNRLEPQKGVFIAESPKVIHVALNAGYEPQALLCEQRHITGDAANLIERCGDIPVYTGERDLLGVLRSIRDDLVYPGHSPGAARRSDAAGRRGRDESGDHAE